MLQNNSTKVETCLASAARSYERGQEAADPAVREFFQQMEGSWMRLAASIAFSERADLLLQNWRHDAGGEHCLRCRGPMELKLIEARAGGETITFGCLNCGLGHVHDAYVEKAT